LGPEHLPPDDVQMRKTTRIKFLNREAAEVYLLLDFLSGRADRSVRPTSDEQGRALLQERQVLSTYPPSDHLTEEEKKQRNDDEKRRQSIEADLQDPTRLVLRTMEIKYPLGEGDEDFEAHATFLMRARDVLNTRAAPATGATIAFTSMLSGEPLASEDHGVTTAGFALSAYPWLRQEAIRLACSIKWALRLMVVFLILALAISAYTAWGKVMLEMLDAVRRDDAATPKVDTPTSASTAVDLTLRRIVTHHHLETWAAPLRWVGPDDFVDCGIDENRRLECKQNRIAQWATAAVSILGNYVMPVLYGFLGSLAVVLRRYYDMLAESTLSPRVRRANSIRLLLGTLIGGCIGLIYSGSSTAQTTGILGSAAALSTAALAFLAGYGVEGVFRSLDGLIMQVFRVNGSGTPKPDS
jgi:hypothetical protein